MVLYTKTGGGEGCLGIVFQADGKVNRSVLGVLQKQ